MCGCGNTGSGFQPCTILLLILILKNQCLLDTDCNPSAKTALTLIFLYWLCGLNKSGCNNGFNMGCGQQNMGCVNNNNRCCCRRSCC